MSWAYKRYSKFFPHLVSFLLRLKTFSYTEHTVINSTACGAAALPLRNQQQLCFYFESSDENTSDITVSSLTAVFRPQVWSLTWSQSLSSAHSRASWALCCCSPGLLNSQPGAQLTQKYTTEEEFDYYRSEGISTTGRLYTLFWRNVEVKERTRLLSCDRSAPVCACLLY